MGKNNNLENKNLTLNSHTDISYNNLPNNDIPDNTLNNSSGILNAGHEAVSNHEEVNDYSFLNVITEEITSLDAVKGNDGLKEILKSSLVDVGSSNLHNNVIADSSFTNLVKDLDNNEYKAFLHNIDNISYLELVNPNNDSYSLHLHHDGYYKVDAAGGLDSILTHIIENNGHKN